MHATFRRHVGHEMVPIEQFWRDPRTRLLNGIMNLKVQILKLLIYKYFF